MTNRDKFEAQYLVHIGAGELPDDVRAMVLQRNGDVYAGQPGSRLNLAWQAYQWGVQDAPANDAMRQQYIESQHKLAEITPRAEAYDKLLTLGPGFYDSNWVGIAALKAIAEACK